MSKSIERNELDEIDEINEIVMEDIKPQRKKRVMREKQKQTIAENLARGREKLKQIHAEKQLQRGIELEEKISKKMKTQENTKKTEDRKLELAIQALEMMKSQQQEQQQEIPQKKIVKKQIIQPAEETETEVEEIIVKKRKPKKKTVIYMDDADEDDTESEPEIKPKRSYRKKNVKNEIVDNVQISDKSTQQSKPMLPQNIVFY